MANVVDTVTLMATPTDGNAMVSAVTLGGAAIADGDFSDGITVPGLLAGANEIVLTVTAENAATQQHTLTVTRTPPPPSAPPTGDDLVSNTRSRRRPLRASRWVRLPVAAPVWRRSALPPAATRPAI